MEAGERALRANRCQVINLNEKQARFEDRLRKNTI